MGISVSIVFDMLRDLDATLHLASNQDFSFEKIQLLPPEITQFSPTALYLGTKEQLKRLDKSALSDICVVCIGIPKEFEQLLEQWKANMILIPHNINLFTVANRLYEGFERVNAWINDVKYAVLSGKSFEEIAVIAAEPFKDSALIFADSSYNVLGSNLKRLPSNPLIDDILSKRYYTKKATDELARIGYTAHSALYTKPLRIDPPNYVGCPLFLVAYHTEKHRVYAFIVLYFYGDKPTEGQLELFGILAEHMRGYLTQQIKHGSSTPAPVELFLRDLIEHTNSDKEYLMDRAQVLGLPLDNPYRLGIVRWEEFSINQAHYLIERLKTILLIPFFRIFLYEDSVLMLIRWDVDRLRVSDDIVQALRDLSHIVEACQGRVGFSNIWSSLLHMNVAFKQAQAAVKYGKIFSPEDVLHFYTHYYFFEVVDSYSKEYDIHDMYFQKLDLLEDPKDSNHTNLILIRNYLCTNGKISSIANMMNLHRNSVIYRLERIQKILGVSLDDPHVQFRLRFSLKVMDYIKHNTFRFFSSPESFEQILSIE